MVTNVHGSWQSHALMLGLDKNASIKEQFFELNSRWDKYPVNPVIVHRDEAPCKENTISDNVNLFELISLYRINEQDGGFFYPRRLLLREIPRNRII